MVHPLPYFEQSNVAEVLSNLIFSKFNDWVISLNTDATDLFDVQLRLKGPRATDNYAAVIIGSEGVALGDFWDSLAVWGCDYSFVSEVILMDYFVLPAVTVLFAYNLDVWILVY